MRPDPRATIRELSWPDRPAAVPTTFSYSSLNDAEECPRRFWLGRASFAGVGRYPEQPTAAVIAGQIVHGILEELARDSSAVSRAGQIRVPTAAPLLELPLRTIALSKFHQVSETVRVNPRTPANIMRSVSVDQCIALVKRIVASLAQFDDTPHAAVRARSDGGGTSAAIPVPAVLAERELRLDRFGLVARIDLIRTSYEGDSIVEFKTGSFRPEHEHQARLYGAMWVGATGRVLVALQVVYPDGRVVPITPPSPDEALAILRDTQSRAEVLRGQLGQSVPTAAPSVENCEFCSVRQLCREYWEPTFRTPQRYVVADLLDPTAGDVAAFDLEVRLAGARWNGPNEFVLVDDDERLVCVIPPRLLPADARGFHAVRLLRVSARREGHVTRILWLDASEAFWLRVADPRLVAAKPN